MFVHYFFAIMQIRTSFLTALALALVLPGQARAQSSDAEFLALLKAQKTSDVETLARERVSQNPKDDIAWSYLAQVVSGNAKKREEIRPGVEKCRVELPGSARCHHAVGTLYAGVASSDGITAALKYASNIKEGFAKAVELDPKNYRMRRDLIQFYLQAPALVGGSVRRAVENANDFSKIDPVRGLHLRAGDHVYEKEWDKAETLLSGIRTTDDLELPDLLTQANVSLGFAMIGDKQYARAKTVFERTVSASPNTAIAHMGLGRALLEQKQTDAAIATLERAIALDAKVGAHYRLSIAYEMKGDKQKAIAALEQFLSYRATGPGVDEAKKRLANMRQG